MKRERGGGVSTTHMMAIAAVFVMVLGGALVVNHQNSLGRILHLQEMRERSGALGSEGPHPETQLRPMEVRVMHAAAGSADKNSEAAQRLVAADAQQASILVGITSFRDVVCKSTIKELFEAADNPSRIFVALVDQVAVGFPKEQCTVDPDADWAAHVRMTSLPSDMGRGPVMARYFASQLYRGEHFWFQTDSHMKFEPRWDTKVIRMWQERVKDLAQDGQQVGERVILSHYPLAYDIETNTIPDNANASVPGHCSGFFNAEGIFQPRDWDMTLERAYDLRLQSVPVAAAGMLFAPATLLHDVPFDPWVPYLFHGEELSYTMRAHAKGYKVYHPTGNIVYHFYGRADRPKTWSEDDRDPRYEEKYQASVERIKLALKMRDSKPKEHARITFNLEQYSISQEARMAWEEEYGIDLAHSTFDHNWC